MRKALRLLLALVLCMALAVGAVAEIRLAPQLDEWDESLPLDVTLSADVAVHMPFDDNRCAQLNALLKHLSLHLNICAADGAELSRVALQVDDAEVAWMMQKENADETQLRLSWQPDTTYSATGDALAMLTGESGMEDISTDKLAWLEDGPALVNSLCDALQDYGKSTSIKTNIKNMGMARKKIIYTVPKADAVFFRDAVLASCPAGSLKELLAGMTVSGQQKLIVWLDADGAMLRAEYAGKCGADADDLRQVKLVWRLCRTEDAAKDDISLKTPAVEGSNYNTLTLTRNLLRSGDGTVTLEGEFSYAVKAGKEKSSYSGKVDLTGAPEGNDTLLTGSLTVKQKEPGDDEASSMVIKPEVRLGAEGKSPVVSGKVQVQMLYDGHTVEDAVISLEVKPGEALTWENADITVDMNAMDDQQLLDMVQQLPQAVVPHLVLLPEEDTLYLSADLPQDVWQQIVMAAQSALLEEVK